MCVCVNMCVYMCESSRVYLGAARRVDNAAIVVAQRVGVDDARDRAAREDLGHDGGLALREK